jgi:hypothetical protein
MHGDSAMQVSFSKLAKTQKHSLFSHSANAIFENDIQDQRKVLFPVLFVSPYPTHPGYLSKLWRRHGSRSTPDRIAVGAAPYHHQMGTLATSARTGTTAEAPGPILTDRLS